MVIDNGTDGMHVPNFIYKAQHGMPWGKLFEHCLKVYSGGTTPLKQKETYALCVPSFMFSCLCDYTLFQIENERSTSQDVCGMARIRQAHLYIWGSRSFMAS